MGAKRHDQPPRLRYSISAGSTTTKMQPKKNQTPGWSPSTCVKSIDEMPAPSAMGAAASAGSGAGNVSAGRGALVCAGVYAWATASSVVNLLCHNPTLSENQVIYHRGIRSIAEGRTQSFETVFSPLRGSAHSAAESKGMAISLEASMTLRLTHEHENVLRFSCPPCTQL